MKKLSITHYRLGILLLSIFLLMNACKKDHTDPATGGNGGDNDSTGSSMELTARDIDSLKFYTWYINISDSENVPWYLWEDQVPEDFPWSSSQYETGNDVMRGIASYPKFEGKNVDKYSFLDMTGEVADELEGGKLGNYGFMVAATQDDNDDFHLYIEYAYAGSPAASAGIKRGDEIVAIDNNTDMDLTSQTAVDRINKALFGSESVSLELRKPDSTNTYTAQIQQVETFHLNPVLFDTVFTIDNKKVGYFVYNSFVSVVSSGNGNTAKQEIDQVFSKFKSEGVSDLIVDLRYNGGGSVPTSEYLDNLIAPASAVGKEMYKYVYNPKLTDAFEYLGQSDETYANLLKPVNFQSVTNNLNLGRIFFVVSGSTASASELTINNLRPYMDVYLVGDTTYGKPVGFFTLSISYVTENAGYRKVADMYSINFKSANSAGQTDYYFGLNPDVHLYDYVDLMWGDPRDMNLASIFSFIKGDGWLQIDDFTRKMQQQRAESRKATGKNLRFMRKIPSSARIKNPHKFNGMVDFRKKAGQLKSRL